jgi:hypothetical protein
MPVPRSLENSQATDPDLARAVNSFKSNPWNSFQKAPSPSGFDLWKNQANILSTHSSKEAVKMQSQ